MCGLRIDSDGGGTMGQFGLLVESLLPGEVRLGLPVMVLGVCFHIPLILLSRRRSR